MLSGCPNVQGYRACTKRQTPWDHRRTLDIVLLYGPRGRRLHLGEVPIYELPDARKAGPPYPDPKTLILKPRTKP